jgi:hypothetical protein
MSYDLYMETVPAAQATQNLGQISASLSQAWSTAQSTIASLEGQLGKDELGQAFLAKYRKPIPAINDTVKRDVDGSQRLATAGQQSIKDYQQADQSVRQEFEGITGAPH